MFVQIYLCSERSKALLTSEPLETMFWIYLATDKGLFGFCKPFELATFLSILISSNIMVESTKSPNLTHEKQTRICSPF